MSSRPTSDQAFDPQRALAQLDAIIAAQLDLILRHPDVVRMERAWRGARRLVENTSFRENIIVELLPCSPAELLVDFDVVAGDLSGSALSRWLRGRDDDCPVAVVIASFDLRGRPDAAVLIDRCATVAERARAVLLVSNVDDVHPNLRRAPYAGHIVMSTPRVMLRAPYLQGGSRIGDALWGGSELVVAQQIAATFATLRHGAAEHIETFPGAADRSWSAEDASRLRDEGWVVLTGATEAGHLESSEVITLNGALLDESMLTSRIAHYLVVLTRAGLPPLERAALDLDLNRWIARYVADADVISAVVRGRRPLRKGAVTVDEQDGRYVFHLTTQWHRNISRKLVATGDLGPIRTVPPVVEAPSSDSAVDKAGESGPDVGLWRAIDGGVGEDVSYDGLFEAIQAEIHKLTDLAGETPHWPEVVHICEEILWERCKDLRVACYWAVAMGHSEGSPQAVTRGIVLLHELSVRYWATMYPPIRRLRARTRILEWWSQQVSLVIAQVRQRERGDPGAWLGEARQRAQALEHLLEGLIGDDFAGFAPVLRALSS